MPETNYMIQRLEVCGAERLCTSLQLDYFRRVLATYIPIRMVIIR